jgi:CRP-like cAMP-binding protein
MLATLKQMAEFVEVFRQHGAKQTFRKDDFIIRPGETPPGVFYIYRGLVKAYDITKYKEENLLIIRKDEEVFPLIWAITGQEHQVAYQALVPTTTWRIDRETFLQGITKQPEAMAPLLDMTVEMYRLHSERILNLEYRTVRERIISFLLTMSRRFGKTTKEGTLINVPLRHQDVASSVNATRETASRELVALERKGLITSSQFLILIKDIKELRKQLTDLGQKSQDQDFTSSLE